MKKAVSLMALFAGMGFAGSMPTEHYTVEDIPLPKVALEIGGLACNLAGELVVVLRRAESLSVRPIVTGNSFSGGSFRMQACITRVGFYWGRG